MGFFDSLFGMVAQKDAQVFNAAEAVKQRQFEHNEAQLAYERTLEADSSKYQRQVLDMQAAGINPMMAVSSGAGSVQSPAASGSSASSPAPPSFHTLSDVLNLEQLRMQRRVNEAQVRNINAQTANTEADTEQKKSSTRSIELANEITEASKDARIKAAELSNDLTRVKVREVEKGLDEIDARIGKLKEESATEESKRELNFAQAVLARANAYQVIQLLPYEIELRKAQTESQRQAALLSAAHAAYQNKLLSDGYIDAFIAEQQAKQSSAEARAVLDQIKTALRTGDWSDLPGYLGNEPDGSALSLIMSGMTVLLDNLNPLNNVFK